MGTEMRNVREITESSHGNLFEYFLFSQGTRSHFIYLMPQGHILNDFKLHGHTD